jgi:16S rRNA pseudouridine516 synthase
MKLVRLVAKHQSLGKTQAQRLIAAGRVTVNEQVCADTGWEVDRFTRVSLDGHCIQSAQRALYLMLHKPAGILSATVDDQHQTVIDLIDDADRHTLHLVGRLDRFTTGLLLLTNDGRWSKRIMDPQAKVPKTYLVHTAEAIADSAVASFAAGFHFPTEDIMTAPALLEMLEPQLARVTLSEGRYHQIKRMFHRIGNRVTQLHRERIGDLHLPAELTAGQWRPLTDEERAKAIFCPNSLAGALV